MTPKEWINKQKQKWNMVREKALEIAALDTHRMMANRIFNDGEDVNNALIGNYNTTTPIYVNPKNSPKKFPTGGKTGKTFKDNKKHKTAFFYSYRDFRAAIGRPTGFVNLNLSGRMQSDFVTGLRRTAPGLMTVQFKQALNHKKARGNERHFGKSIFSLSSEERKHFINVLQRETNRLINA